MGLKYDAWGYLLSSRKIDLNNTKIFVSANKLLKEGKWRYEIMDTIGSLKILNDIPNYINDWKILPATNLYISFIECQKGNKSEAILNKNKALQHGFLNYYAYDKIYMEIYNYTIGVLTE